ncbi:sensor histidine kinase [Ureibacillus acetophenoni]|uniref:Two-component system sensor histidine kinase ComP n=1 Tax=Ureibacillus acetophenoni TaxID=614649 RepID=A0A285U3D4_9BACL|nr:ATP-binding protein [Ureibacillus acetophenoni]SOC36470.1 two-component system sensor histidine kinase ComP [Ureibacillus acetophenoni]
MISRKWFWIIISLYLILGFYIFYTSYQSPTAGIEVEQKNDQCIVVGLLYPELEEIHKINRGDTILKVNGKDINDTSKLKYDSIISFADSATVMNSKGEVRQIIFSHDDLPYQFFNNYILPLCYFLAALFLAIYLYRQQKGNQQALNYLILFILTVAIACGSIPLYMRLNWFGIIINSTTAVLSPILLLSFLKHYYTFLSIHWRIFNYVRYLYIIPIFVLVLTIVEDFYPSMFFIDSLIILSLFFILIMINIAIIIAGYIKYPKSQIKVIFWFIIFPIIPFLVLYVVPLLILQKYIISTSILSIFFLFMSFGFTFAQISERLFDVEYYISRLKYYSLFSLVITLGLVLGIYIITSLPIYEIVSLSIFIFLFILVSFYIREKLDYINRKVLFTPQGNYIHQLYTSIDSIGKTTTREELFQKLSSILAKQLEFNVVYVIGFNISERKIVENKLQTANRLHDSIDISLFENLQLMEISNIGSCYIACIHQDIEMKQILILGNENHSSLKHEELLALELLILYVNNFIDNTKLVEELLAKLKTMEQKDDHPYWFEKLVLLKLEEEKTHLAQDLHDTVLQEQIFLIREMDSILNETNVETLQAKITDFHHQLVSINHQLRAYCEILKPPLLDTLGLNAALNKLFMQTKKRANFTLLKKIEQIDLKNKYTPLFIYRLIQELLTNAIKHSQATYVKIQLLPYENGFEIKYMDNGVGFDIEKLKTSNSMGLAGMKERVRTYNGYFEIDTYPNEGLQIQIRVGED